MTRHPLTISASSSSLSTDLRRAADDAHLLGFDGLTLDVATLDDSARTGSGRREVARIVTSRGLKLVALSLDLPPKALLDARAVDRALGATLREIELAAGVRARLLTIDLGALPEVAAPPDTPGPPPTPLEGGLLLLPTVEDTARYAPGGGRTVPARSSTRGDFSLGRGFLHEAACAADRFGVSLALGSSLASLDSLQELLRGTPAPIVGLDLDPTSLLRDGWSVEDGLDRFADRVLHVRGRDAVAGAAGRFREAPIGQGDIPWRDVMGGIDESGRIPPLTIDPRGLPDPRAAAAIGLQRLRSLLA